MTALLPVVEQASSARRLLLLSAPAPPTAPPHPSLAPLPVSLQHGKWVTDNATIGGKFVSATLEERNSFMDVSARAWNCMWQLLRLHCERDSAWVVTSAALRACCSSCATSVCTPHPQLATHSTTPSLLPPQVAYGAIDNLLRAPGSAFKGALFWQWFSPGQEAPASEGGGRGLFGERSVQGCREAPAPAGGCPVGSGIPRLLCGRRSCDKCTASERRLPATPRCAGIYETDDAFRPILENARAGGAGGPGGAGSWAGISPFWSMPAAIHSLQARRLQLCSLGSTIPGEAAAAAAGATPRGDRQSCAPLPFMLQCKI